MAPYRKKEKAYGGADIGVRIDPYGEWHRDIVWVGVAMGGSC